VKNKIIFSQEKKWNIHYKKKQSLTTFLHLHFPSKRQ